MECGKVKCQECGDEVDEQKIIMIGYGIDESEVCKKCYDYLNILAAEKNNYIRSEE